jgi:hypothetical protein
MAPPRTLKAEVAGVETSIEHAAAKDLIAQLENMDPDDDLYAAKVTVLSS